MPDSQSTEARAAARLFREVYFPTFIYYIDLADGAAINRSILPHIYRWREEDQDGLVRSNVRRVGSWHSNVDMHVRAEYQALQSAIVKTAQAIFDDLKYDPDFAAAIDNMWANINPRHGYNRNHMHPYSLWSGVYYVQAPADAGRIFFTDPRPQALMGAPRFGNGGPRPTESWTEVYYQPVEGRLILFPSWLLHEVEPNMSDLEGPAADRISVSFNIIQKRRAKP